MKYNLQNLLFTLVLAHFFYFNGFSQILNDEVYQIYSETHDATFESPIDVNQDDSGDGQINNLFATTSNINNAYQLFEFVHQGSDVYKIKNLGTNQFIGIKDNWCGDGGEVIARFGESDTNTEFSITQDPTSGQFIIQIAFTDCNFGSVNDPARSFDLGSPTGKVRTFGDTGSNQQFRLKSVSPVVESGTYRIFADANNQFLESPVNVNEDDSGDATVNNLFTSTLNESNDYQEFEFTYRYTNQNGDIYTIQNLGTNQYVGLKDNFCGDFGEVIARFDENDNEAQIVVSSDENSGRILFQKDDAASCSYFDLTGAGKIRTFNDTGFNQQFRAISTASYIYDTTWSPAVPTGGEDVFILNGTFTTSSDISFNSIVVSSDASVEVSPSDVLSITEELTNRGNFTFKSDASGSAQLADVSEVTIRGNFTVERFIPKRIDEARAFRFLTSSVGNVNIADAWQQNTHITGAVGNVGETSADGFDQTPTGAASMFTYNHSMENQIGGEAGNATPWEAIASTNQDIEAGKPYRLFVRGDRSTNDFLTNTEQPATDVTLSATGTLHTGVFNVETSNFSENFTFIGNPYQAVVDLNKLTYGDGVNSNAIYYWDPALGDNGGFVTVSIDGSGAGTPNPSSSNADEFLRPNQAVFIRNNDEGTDYSIQFNEDDKDTLTEDTQTQVFSVEEPTAFVNLRVYKTQKLNNQQAEEDALGLRFSETGNNEIDQFDIVKMGNPGVNFTTVNSNQLLAIENRAIPEENEEVVQLFLNNLQTEEYTIRWHAENLPVGVKMYINDAYLNTSTEILEGFETYSFEADQNLPESVDLFRFSISFENVSLSMNGIETETNIAVYPNPTKDVLQVESEQLKGEAFAYSIFDIQGRQIMGNTNQHAEDGHFQINLGKLADGLYTLNIRKDGYHITKKIIKN